MDIYIYIYVCDTYVDRDRDNKLQMLRKTSNQRLRIESVGATILENMVREAPLMR